MVKNKELRVGNLVFEDPKLLTLHEIVWHELGLDDVPFEPIPLTPEILDKCGFEKNEDSGNWHSPDHIIYSLKGMRKGMSIGIKDEYIGWYNSCDDDFYSSFYPELKSLHQLQNLYFSLNGEELEIKL